MYILFLIYFFKDCLNICTFTLGQILGRKALERNGFYYMGDLVSKFVRGQIRGKLGNHDKYLLDTKWYICLQRFSFNGSR